MPHEHETPAALLIYKQALSYRQVPNSVELRLSAARADEAFSPDTFIVALCRGRGSGNGSRSCEACGSARYDMARRAGQQTTRS